MTKQLLLITLLFFAFIANSQEIKPENSQIDGFAFNDSLFEKLLLKKFNERRIQIDADSLRVQAILQAASDDQVAFMAKYGEAEVLQSGKMKTTGQRIEHYGGAQYGEELVLKYSLKSGDKAPTYEELADEIATKWLKSKKTAIFIEDSKFIFTGISAGLNEDKSKLFISVVFGNYRSLKSGAERVAELDKPFSKKKYGLKPYDAKACKKVEDYKGLSTLQKGLSLEDGTIYFETQKYKSLKKIMKKPKDAIAVDIVQKDQYSCAGLNIIDNNTSWKGIMLKRAWAPKMEKKNMYTDKKDRKSKLKVAIGKMPEGLGEDIELNLLIIQDKHVCANIPPSYVEAAALENSSKLDYLADTVTTEADIEYTPIAEQTTLSFRVPFERNKSEYQKSDIQPIIKQLKEPDFIIDNIKINAYSSIEGDNESNKRLQKKRAESIENALKGFIATHENIKQAEVNTDENWDDFKNDVASTEYSNMGGMSLEEAQAYIKSEGLTKKLEPILQNHRYAEVILQITYDIKGNKEQAYVVSRFNKAVKASDREKALQIQKFIFKKVLSGEYDKEAVTGQEIPESAQFAGIMMNKIWLLKYLKLEESDGEICEKVHTLFQLDSSNPYLFFNDVFCDVKEADLADEKRVNDIRQRIDKLYETNLPEKTVDALNLEYLFSVIEAVDTVPETPELAVISLQKIKDLVDIQEMNWKNALKLSYLFIEHNDFNYSAKLLEPFIPEENVFEEIIFTYISLATHSNVRINSSTMSLAVKKAIKQNPERLKELFTTQRITVQVFDNQEVKDLFCKELKL
ncbi:MAG: hypothetical protein JXR60_03415 [Bacteroidales bacterium]|nr:hypothetical protein [Bacteroidales bacterium]